MSKTAHGRIIADSSWRPYCRKSKQFSTALQFGSQIFSNASNCENSRSRSSRWTRDGKNRRFFRRGAWRKSETNQRWSMSKDERPKSSVRLSDVHMPFEECWNGDTAPKMQRWSCTPRCCCKRRFRILCSIYWTRFISISNDGSKRHGYHVQTAGMLRTSSGRSICLYPGKNEICSKITENSQIERARHLDSSITTQMAQIMVQYGRPSRSSWAKSVRSSFGTTVLGKAICENPVAARFGRRFPIGNACSYTAKRDCSDLMCVWHQTSWNESKHWCDVESTQ